MLTKKDLRELREPFVLYDGFGMKRDEDIGLFTKILLKVITFLQESALKLSNTSLYYKLTKLHFKLYFGMNLTEELLIHSHEFQAAQRRHASMVVALLFGYESKVAFKAAKAAFIKNLLLEVRL